MSDAVNCEYCVNYSYDDDYECYTCEINLDEDENGEVQSPETSISVHTSRWVTNTALYVSRCRIYKK